jgi:hypothetical protein
MPRMPRMQMQRAADSGMQEMGRAVETARTFMPPPERIIYYGALGALAVFGLVEWPVAAAIGVGTMIAQRTRRRGQGMTEERDRPPGTASRSSGTASRTAKTPSRATSRTTRSGTRATAASSRTPKTRATGSRTTGSSGTSRSTTGATGTSRTSGTASTRSTSAPK